MVGPRSTATSGCISVVVSLLAQLSRWADGVLLTRCLTGTGLTIEP
jgi:hypothetical protein